MSEFTFLFRGRQTSASPEEIQKHLERWVAWMKQLGANGHIKEQGHPLEGTGKVVKGQQKIVNDGPYAETKEQLGGILILEATDLNHAIQLMSKHPGVKVGPFEIRPAEDLTPFIRESNERRHSAAR